MEAHRIIKENWLTRKPNEFAFLSSLLLGVVLVMLSYFFLNGIFDSGSWMAANPESVFKKHEYWRLWTTLFAHADIEHLLSNLMLLVPLSYMLSAYFGMLLFPIAGLLFGGLINYLVLQAMPPSVDLIGISGLVYWMGAVWLTLYILIDRRKSLRRRIAVSFLLTVVLFIPETYRPEVSYLSHLVGYILGIAFGIGVYLFRSREFASAQVFEVIYDDPSFDLGRTDLDAPIKNENLISTKSPDAVQLPKSGI